MFLDDVNEESVWLEHRCPPFEPEFLGSDALAGEVVGGIKEQAGEGFSGYLTEFGIRVENTCGP